MKSTQCLTYALRKWVTEGGYIMLRKSEHWLVPHVLHLSADRSVLTHFVPLEKLKQPWHAVFGFEGEVRYADTAPAPKMSRRGVLLGILALVILGVMWAVEPHRKD